MPRRSSTIVMAGHFPPPVHGESVAVDALAQLFDQHARVVRIRTTPRRAGNDVGYHLERVARVAIAAVRVAAARARSRTLYLSVDAGLGMIYTAVLAGTGRLLRYQLYIHHHSYAYLHATESRFAQFARVSGSGAIHLVGCTVMRDDLTRLYPRVTRVEVLPIGYAAAPPQSAVNGRSRERLTLGHMANLSLEKGLLATIEVLRELLAARVPARLLLAGPASSPDIERLLRSAIEETPEIEWLGGVYGTDRDAFFARLDAFVFPSQYVHESFGLVVAEAQQRGVPVLAHRVGCLTDDVIGAGGLLVDRSDDFVTPAVAWLTRAHEDRSWLAAAGAAARRRGNDDYREAERVTAEMVRTMAVRT